MKRHQCRFVQAERRAFLLGQAELAIEFVNACILYHQVGILGKKDEQSTLAAVRQIVGIVCDQVSR